MKQLIRKIQAHDIGETWLDDFERHQTVTRMMYVQNGRLIEKAASFTEDWSPSRLREITKGIRAIVQRGGKAVAAYKGNNLIGFAAVEPELFAGEYINLDVIHVTKDRRGIGVGKALFQAIAEEAKELGGKYLYISGHPSVESQAFYRKMGCVLAKTIHPELYALEPEDIHLEYDLSKLPDPTSADDERERTIL